MTVDSVQIRSNSSTDSSKTNDIAFVTSIGFSILCFLSMSMSMLMHIDCNMMIGIFIGFIVGSFAEVITKKIVEMKPKRVRPKKPPDKFTQSKMSTRLIVIFGFAFVAILSSSATNYRSSNSLILNDDLEP